MKKYYIRFSEVFQVFDQEYVLNTQFVKFCL